MKLRFAGRAPRSVRLQNPEAIWLAFGAPSRRRSFRATVLFSRCSWGWLCPGATIGEGRLAPPTSTHLDQHLELARVVMKIDVMDVQFERRGLADPVLKLTANREGI